jgi:signal transduction histidine kinase
MRVVRMRSDFVSSVSHELKTPLTAIRMFAETLRMQERPDPAVQTEYLDTIVGESERLTRLLNNVLDVSRIERGQKSYRREPASLGEIAERAVRALEYPLRRDGFRLNTTLENGLPALPVDGDAIEQAILNLLTNAMKYSGDSREIDLRLRRQDGYAVIDVSDHGVGIPEEARDRVTEKFYRVPTSENERIPGSGLGLTIVEHAVRAHGGRLEVRSAVGEGSTFSIHLPLTDSEAMP